MFITHLNGPSGVEFEDAHIQDPTWWNIEQAIRRLDGYHLNSLSFYRSEQDEDKHKRMVVADGENGLFYVMVTISSINRLTHHFYLVDPSYPDKEEVWSFLASQSDTECYRYEMNRIEATLKAARTFAETGELEPGFTWKHP